jgi:hypothetical protein
VNNLEKLLAAGASVIMRPVGSEGLRFFMHKYGVAVEYRNLRNGLLGDDLEEILGRGLEWVKDVDYCAGRARMMTTTT